MLLEAVAVTKRFGAFTAIDALSLQIAGGGVEAIIGPNGAGKSTFLNLLGGQLAPTAGRILLRGAEIGGLPAHRMARRGIGRSFQVTNVLPGATCLENVRVAAQARRRRHSWLGRVDRGSPDSRRAAELLAFVGIAARADDPASVLSHGEQRHLEIAIAIAAEPAVVLLDEPTAGMSLTERARMAGLIRDLGRRMTVVLVEHDVGLVRQVADQVHALHQGRVLCRGTADAVFADDMVQAVYLRRASHAGTA